MWVLFAFGSAFFAGLTAILAKVGIQDTDSNVVTAIRTFVVLLFSWLLVFLTGAQRGIWEIEKGTLVFLILSGLATGASWLCYFKALYLGDVNRVTPIDKSGTVLTMLLAVLFLGEPITWLKGICMLLITAGTYLMIAKKPVQDGRKTDIRWLFYACVSAAFASMTSILAKIGMQGIDSGLGTAVRTVVVLMMSWIVVFVTKKQSSVRTIDRKSLLFICLSGIATGGSWLCYFKALQTGPASVVVPIDKLSIVLTVGFAYVFLKEKLTKKSFAGLLLIVTGTLLLLLIK
ncbi:MAG: EamA family transporter [Lachnospiraceae bacterium]